MDRFASNTLRTLAIVVISIFVIISSLVLLLFALCAGLFWKDLSRQNPHLLTGVMAAMATAGVIIVIGVVSIAKLSKGIVREPAIPQLRPNIPAAGTAASGSSVERSSTAIPPVSAAPVTPPPPPAPISTPEPTPPQPYSAPDVVTHLSPASRAAIHRLVLAIVVQIATQGIPLVLGWLWAFRAKPESLQPILLILIWALASNAPYLVLLFSLLRSPGRRTFAYALTIPSILILFGTFGSSATIFYLLQRTHSSASFLMVVPWALHVLIFYLAWKAIRLTGILPNPARIIASAAVVFFYYTLLPVLLGGLAYLQR